MRVEVGRQFQAEAARFALRFTCADCVYHVARRDACAHEWPDAEHRAAPAIPPGGHVRLSFCKEFELR